MVLTWTKADVARACMALTWLDDVRMTSLWVQWGVARVCDVHWRVKEKPENRVVHEGVCNVE